METKCAAFWKHTNLRSDNRIFPCCRFKTPLQDFDGNLEKVLKSDEYSKLREKSKNNQTIPGCEKCYYEESLGKKSLRQEFNETYDTETVELKYFEVGFDNICNLTCDGCWQEFSSSWGKKLELDKSIIVKSTTDIDNIPSTINRVLFLGGEPLMTTRHKKFLNQMPNLNQLEVTYNTNATFLLDRETIDLLNQCKDVSFIISIDGYGELNDKVRSGSNWNDICKFIDQIKELNFKFTIHTVIHLNNWQGLKDLEMFIKQNNYAWSVNLLTYPQYLNINNFKPINEVINYIETIDLPNKESILKHLKQ